VEPRSGSRRKESEFDAAIPEFPAAISDGHVAVSETIYENLIPLPLTSDGPASISLTLPNGGKLDVSGSLLLQLLGEPRFVESFPGA